MLTVRIVTVLVLGAISAFPPSVLAQAQEVVDGQGAPGGQVVQSVNVEGNRLYTDQEILASFGVTAGERYDQRAIERGIEDLFQTYRVLARVEFRAAAGDAGGIDLLVRVEKELSRDLEPRFVGNEEIDDEEILKWAGTEEGSDLYLYQAARVRERLLRKYHAEGFYFADVRVVQRTGAVDEDTGEPLASDVIFEIKEGPRVRVRDVKYHGNKALGAGQFLFFRRGLPRLAEVELRAPAFFGLFSKKLDMDVLNADLVAIRQVYRDFGYLDAVVDLEELEFDEKREWVTIHIVIDEGELYHVRSVRIEGVERVENPPDSGRFEDRPADLLFPEEELLGLLTTKPGGVYDKLTRQDDLRALRLYYGKKGYIDHPSLPEGDRLEVLDPELVFDEHDPLVDIVYRIAQGRQQFIREVRVVGNLHTRDRVIRRLITVDPGDAANPEEIERSRQRIQGTGWFSDPRDVVGHRDPYYRFVETGDPYWKDLEYVVDEGQDLTFNISGGLSSNLGAFGIVQFTKQNFDITNMPERPWTIVQDVAARRAFHGAGQTLRLRASPGTQVSFFDVFFLEPDIFGRQRDRISLSLNARRRLRTFDSHDEQREEFGFEVGRQVGPDSSVFLGYTYGTVEVTDIDGGGEPVLNDPIAAPLTLIEQEGKSDIAHARFGYRRRTTDSRINPRNGVSLRFQNQAFDGTLGSDFDFFKSEVLFDLYDEIEGTGDGVPDRYHLDLQGGVATPYGSTGDVPYSERFFLGGQRTLRGFDFRGVGPNQKGIPLGGETYLYGSFEYRHPLVTTTQPGTYRSIETLHMGAFVDAGVLGVEDFGVDFSDFRVSAGLLFGISVPLPITFSFGFPLIDGPGDQKQVLGFNIGF